MAPTLRAIDRLRSLSDQTYSVLRYQLRSGQFSSGRVLPEVSLADLGVSRTPVREALLRFVCEGLLEPSGRSFVRPALLRADINEIYELRFLFEPEAARQLARQSRGHEARAVDNTAAFIDANHGYRAARLELVPNRRSLRAIELYADQFRYLKLLALGDHGARKVVITGLKRLTAAFAAAKSDEAAAAMRHRLGEAKRILQGALELEENGDLRYGV